MENIKRSFRKIIRVIKDKWLRQTSLTLLLVAIIVCIFIVLNMIISNLNLNPLDFTQEKIYSLSEDSINEIKKVEQNVTLYYFGYTDSETPVILGNQYHNANEKITVQMVSTAERPDLASEYQITSNDKLVAVASSQRYKVVDSNDMYTYDTTSYQQMDVTEQKLTNAILDVTIVSKPQVYFLTGHNEYGISESEGLYMLSQYIGNEVNDVATLDLLSADMPEKCDVLVIANPEKDFTDVETGKIQTYINNGGKIFWLQDPYINIRNFDVANFKNINSILSQFGISFSKGIVVEQSTDNMIAGLPDLIIPNMTYNEIVKDIYTDGKIIMADAGKINTVSTEELEKLGVTASPFVKTSEKAYYKEKFDMTATTLTKSAEDEEGSYVLGEILTKKINDEKSSTLVAYSNALFASDMALPMGNTATTLISLRNNKDIILNSVAYLTNREDSIRIRKDTGVVTFNTATATQDTIVKTIIFSVPILIIIAGIVITIIRKRKK
ncbi:MAG: GldG family protein [Clostridia bacterium]|nr:GldG family protein [Clostridia bacterium]